MPLEFNSNLLTDRVKFKLFAAERHLNNLKEMQLNYSKMEKDNQVVQIELEIDCFLAQILGAVDCLLILINTRLELGISTGKVDLATVQSALNARTKSISLLTELHQALERDRWLWTLMEFRNRTMQGPSIQAEAFLLDDNLISFFEQCVKRVRELVSTIRMKEPLLK